MSTAKNSLIQFRNLSGALVIIASLVGSFGSLSSANAQTKGRGKRVNVEKLKKQYWKKEDSYDVVQNRVYSKANKLEFSLFGGITSSDPFVDIKSAGASIGYHFNEYVSAHLHVWKMFSSDSRALDLLQEQTGASAATNFPELYIGGEVEFSVIYGKLSLLGDAIIYYDLHLLGGVGRMDTESGNYFTGMVGIGQQFHLSQLLSLRIDYRFSYYKEDLIEKVSQANLGNVIDNRANLGSNITLGLSFMF